MKNIAIVNQNVQVLSSQEFQTMGEHWNLQFHDCKLAKLISRQYSEQFAAAIIILADKNDWVQLEKVIQEFNAPLFLAYHFQEITREEKIHLNKLCEKSIFRGSVVDISDGANFLNPVLKLIQNSVSTVELHTLRQRLNILSQNFSKELSEVKNLHKKLFPLRANQLRGLKLSTKYGVGNSSGGEFFDIVQLANHVYFFLTSSSSYLTTGMILDTFSSLHQCQSFADIEKHLIELDKGLQSLKKSCEFELLFADLDVNTLKLQGYNFGKATSFGRSSFSLNSNGINFSMIHKDKAYFNETLQRNDKMVILSPGVRKNFRSEEEYFKLLKDLNVEDDNYDILNEIFVRIPKNDKDFYENDAFALVIEIDSNIMLQV